MIIYKENHCRACKHFLGRRQCLSFPAHIPDDLWSGDNLHHAAYEGDHGYRYQPAFDELPPLPDHFFDSIKADPA
jgi:hypothetical protein